MLTRPRLGGPLGLDPNDLTAAERAAVRARLMGRLGTLALRARDERRREDELLAQERGQVDPEIRRDRLRVQRRGRLRGAAQHIDRAVVLLREASEHRRLDPLEAPAALPRHARAGLALEIGAWIRVRREDVRVDARHARLDETGVLASRIDR